MLAWTLIAASAVWQDARPTARLKVGEGIESVIATTDPIVSTERIDAKRPPKSEARGRSFAFEAEESGAYAFEARSYECSPYLVLRDDTGKVLAENGDGLWGILPRIVATELLAGRKYTIQVCTFDGDRGAFALRAEAARKEAESPAESRAAGLEYARAGVRALDREGAEPTQAVAHALDCLGQELLEDQKFDEAEAPLERAVGIREHLLGDHNLTASSLNNLGACRYYQGRLEEAQQLLERSVAIQEKVYGPEHPEVAANVQNAGCNAQWLGDYRKALALYERALAIREKVFGREGEETASTLAEMYTVLRFLGDYDRAREVLERAISIRTKRLGSKHPDTAACRLHLAAVLTDIGDYSAAHALFEQGLRDCEEALGGDSLVVGGGLQQFAILLNLEGQYTQARAVAERAVAWSERVFGPEHFATAGCLDALGSILDGQELSEEAEAVRRREIAIYEKTLGPSHPVLGQALNNLAGGLKNQDKNEEARRSFERALSIEEGAYGPAHPEIAKTLGNLGGLLASMHAYADAEALIRRALDMFRKTLGADSPLALASQGNLGVVLAMQGKYAEARPLVEAELHSRETIFGPENPETIASLGNYVSLLMGLGLTEEAWPLAQRAFESSGRYERASRRSLSEAERLLVSASMGDHLGALVGLALSRHDVLADRAAYGAVLAWKGRVSRDLLLSQERLLRDSGKEVKRLAGELRALQSRISNELYSSESSGQTARENRLRALRERRSQLEREVSESLSSPATDEDATVSDLASALPTGSALVDLLVFRAPRIGRAKDEVPTNLDETRVVAWILRAGGDRLVCVDLGDSSALEQASKEFLESLIQSRGKPAAAVSMAANDRLRNLLWKPLGEHLEGVSLIFVSPDRFLGTLPFETLRLEDGSYLVEHFGFVYASDMATVAGTARRPPARAGDAAKRLLVMGDVDYDARAGKTGSGAAAPTTARAELRGGIQEFWEPLHFTQKEAATVAALHENAGIAGSSARLLDRERATEEELKRSMPGCGSIHLATHGYFEPAALPSMWDDAQSKGGQPFQIEGEARRITGLMPGLLSGLVCSGANLRALDGGENGLLTAEEVTWLDLSDCDLVVLSACETGLGTVRGGEGMISLRRAFQMAGARTVISSLWSVQDEDTVDLMRSFYRRLWIEKRSKVEALRGAQLEALKKYRATHHGDGQPYLWGAFVLAGDWR